MRTLIAIAILLLFGAFADSAWASEGGGGELISPDWKTIVTSIVVFLILLFVLTKAAWKPILEGLQKREDTIKKALDDAKEAHEQAKALIAEYEAKIDKAREEAQSVFDEARRDAQDIRDQIESDARARADETVERSKREIEQLHAKAWDSLVRDAATIAVEAASRIIQKDLGADGHAEIVASVVSDFTSRSGRGGAASEDGSA
jgi:F-type H+-transporting ATPase subunit b